MLPVTTLTVTSPKNPASCFIKLNNQNHCSADQQFQFEGHNDYVASKLKTFSKKINKNPLPFILLMLNN